MLYAQCVRYNHAIVAKLEIAGDGMCRGQMVGNSTPANGERVKEWGLAPSKSRNDGNYRRVARCLSPFFHILGL